VLPCVDTTSLLITSHRAFHVEVENVLLSDDVVEVENVLLSDDMLQLSKWCSTERAHTLRQYCRGAS
jgi:hypothetical protein